MEAKEAMVKAPPMQNPVTPTLVQPLDFKKRVAPLISATAPGQSKPLIKCPASLKLKAFHYFVIFGYFASVNVNSQNLESLAGDYVACCADGFV
jgi:hypothetical protein